MKKICIYGKGGIGKSTIVSNLAAALADSGHKVAVIGCDPKADSTRNIMRGKIPTILDMLHDNRADDADDYIQGVEWVQDIAAVGYKRILCMESGGPSPGTGCAGRGIVAALDAIKSRDILSGIDIVLYDVLGDVVCGGFSAPLRQGVADQVYLVTTSDYMAMYAANNICKGIAKYANSGSVGLAGVIYNGKSGLARAIPVQAFAAKIGTKVIGDIPLSPLISRAEIKRQTVIQAYPDDPLCNQIRKLAKAVYENQDQVTPTPLSYSHLEQLAGMCLEEDTVD